MPTPVLPVPPALPFVAAPAPSTPLGPFADSAVAWTTWVALMGSVGLVALALTAAGPAALRCGAAVSAAVTRRLARAAAVLAVLVVPAVLTELARDGDGPGGYRAAWGSLFDGSADGLLSGLEVTLALVGAALLVPLTVRRGAAGTARRRLVPAALGALSLALITTRFPDEAPDAWGRTIVQTLVWVLHLLGGAVWIGGLIGLLLLALPGAVDPAHRGGFWSVAIRRFAVTSMTGVGAITLSGLFLYWQHVDGPSQLLHTMYGRVLGVKILIVGTMVLLGAVNQFWLHPRIEALRTAGDPRPSRAILVRTFPAVVAAEVLLGLTVLFVAPFLHGSARNQAYQADVARHSATALAPDDLPKLQPKQAGTATWVWGTAETVAVVVVMVGGYRISGRLARRRVSAAQAPAPAAAPSDAVEV